MTRPYYKVSGVHFVFLCICTGLLSGCSGYQFGRGGTLVNQYSTISVPYVEGDLDGSMTASIINELARSGCFRFRQCDGDLTLKVKITDLRDENIGFRYDRKKKGELTHSIIPTETRLTAYSEVVVENSRTGCAVLGPVRVRASVDFDHDYYSNRDGVNIFSLGQLNDVDAACDAAQLSLNEALAGKIVDYLCNSW
jgi:hypothetical protein